MRQKSNIEILALNFFISSTILYSILVEGEIFIKYLEGTPMGVTFFVTMDEVEGGICWECVIFFA
jgi:hypothetical protein